MTGNRGRVGIDARKIMSKLSVFGLALWNVRQAKSAARTGDAGLKRRALNPVVGTEMPLRARASGR